MHRSRITCAVVLALVLCTSVTMTSCGGGGASNPDLVLLGFNVPNLSGIALNQPLIFTFSANINPSTITPDSLRVVGTQGPFFEDTVVDGNLVALLPTTPNFADYSDAGFQPNVQYTVSLTEFPAVTTIETTTGKPLLEAETFTFRTLPVKSSDIVSNIRCNGADGILGTADDDTPSSPSFFIEPRRPIRRGAGWTVGLRGDDDGCLQNSAPGNTLYRSPSIDPSALQQGSGLGARLLCLQNEGSPRIIESLCVPRHNQQAVGNPSAVNPGFIDMPAIRIKFSEPLDPLTVEPWFSGVPVNVQLWRVAFKDGTFTGPDQIQTNKPIVVQTIEDTEVILTAAGPVPQGVYVVNVTPGVKDLPGCPLRINDRPDPGANGYDLYESEGTFQAAMAPGYRIYFKTLEVPDTPLAIIEDFGNNLSEWGDNGSGTQEPGLFSQSIPDGGGAWAGNPLDVLPLGSYPFNPLVFGAVGGINGDPSGSLGGQSTTAAWNVAGSAAYGDNIGNVAGYRFLNLPTLVPNPNVTNPHPGSLQAVHQPWAGNGSDGAFDSGGGGATLGWNTNSGSSNADGVWEVTSFHLRAGDTLNVTGSKPLLILCQGDFTLDGVMNLSGQNGGAGFDTDGTSIYTHANAAAWFGLGGTGGPGGGRGGDGNDPENAANGAGAEGGQARTLFDAILLGRGGGGPATAETVAGSNDGSTGGGGGGFGASGVDGTSLGASVAPGGVLFGDTLFNRDIALFQPDRGYDAFSNITGGGGGGGGSSDDDNGASESGDTLLNNGDDAGGGGGGGGGGLWVIARGTLKVGSSAIVRANGGNGGNTYGPADQVIDPGDDADIGTAADNFFAGLSGTPAVGSGDGGPGGGGAGGGIFLIGRAGIDIQSGSLMEAKGGLGGTSGDVGRVGGDGANGRISVVTGNGSPLSVGGTATPALDTYTGWNGTIDLGSVGQSDWVDLFTPNSDFAPIVGGQQQFPSFHANFTLDLGNPGFLELPTGVGGGGQTLGVDFDARFEFQGATNLNDSDGDRNDPLQTTPVEADGLTQWWDVSMINNLDLKRFIRWRWRFYARDGYGTGVGDPANLPLPTVFDITIPFVKQ